MLHRFYGGVRPDGRKGATRGLAVVPMETAPVRVILPLTAPLVAVGEKVKVGQRLCDGGGDAPAVHASVSGTVVAIEPRVQADGTPKCSVIIENDGLDTPAPVGRRIPAETLPGAANPAEIRAAISWVGLSGMGGGSIPKAGKLSAALGRAQTLIINAVECDSYLTADHRLLLERTGDVLTGARLLARALGVGRTVIALMGDKYDAAVALRGLLPLRGGDVEIKVLRVRYPQGSERQLIQRLTGRRMPPGGGPADVGCALFNVHTAAAVTDAVYGGRPLTHRIVTVTGGALRTPKNLLVPLGTPISDLIWEAGGWAEHPERLLVGGGMGGLAQQNLEAPVTQGVGGVVAMTRREAKPAAKPEGACLRCGRCVEVCPMRLTPVYLRLYARKERWSELERLHITDCMECGACAYACPARLKLVGDIRAGKEGLRQWARQEEASHDENP